MRYKLQFALDAEDDLRSLDKQTARRILTKLRWFVVQENPLRFARRLTSSIYGDYRFRVGDHRVIFDLARDNIITIILVLRIRHRREVYE